MLHHDDLIGRPDAELLELCPYATHQHYKGGLYRLLGHVRDSEGGHPVLGADGEPRVLYQHCFPYPVEHWLRDASEFHGHLEDGRPRFRELTRA